MHLIQKFLNFIFRRLPIQPKKVLFIDNYGQHFGGNPEYISNYLKREAPDWQRVWAVRNPSIITDDSVKITTYDSTQFLYHFATAQIIITNRLFELHWQKRKHQLYLQTWHSFLDLKKIDGQETSRAEYRQKIKKDKTQIDCILAGCEESENHFQETFGSQVRILKSGNPRIDPLIHIQPEPRAKARRRFRTTSKEKILLYAPAFRAFGNYSSYIYDFSSIQQTLSEVYGGKWKVLVRLHPLLKDISREIYKIKGIHHASLYPDIQELLQAADFLITDYSSVMFDFMFLKKPTVLYTPDLQDYQKNNRSLYFSMEDLPYPTASTIPQLIKEIKAFNIEKVDQKVDYFIQKVGSFEDGHAAEKVFAYLKQQIEPSQPH